MLFLDLCGFTVNYLGVLIAPSRMLNYHHDLFLPSVHNASLAFGNIIIGPNLMELY